MMIRIVYPEVAPKLSNSGNERKIWCMIRRRWLVFTPEEWVRQNFLLFLTERMQYPLSLIAVEKKVLVGELSQRFDIVVFDSSVKPWLLIECKEPGVKLSNETFFQAMRYHRSLQASFICITNGNEVMLTKTENGELIYCDAFPEMAKVNP